MEQRLRPINENAPCALYRHFDSTGDLLYVGIAASPASRQKSHGRTSHWYLSVKKITIQWFSSRLAAMKAEKVAIICEAPKHNKALTTIKAAAENLEDHIAQDLREKEFRLSKIKVSQRTIELLRADFELNKSKKYPWEMVHYSRPQVAAFLGTTDKKVYLFDKEGNGGAHLKSNKIGWYFPEKILAFIEECSN